MGSIRPLSASLASLFSISLCFIMTTVHLFSGTSDSELTILYGAGIIVFVLMATITGADAGFGECLSSVTSLEVSSRTWCMCAVTYLSARGTYYLVMGAFIITDKKFQHSLFPGLCAFLIIFIMFSGSSYLQRDYFISLLSLSMVIACAFEIASLWHCMPIAVATSYIMPGVLLILRVIRGLKDYTLPRPYRNSEKNADHDVTKLYFVVGQVTSAICYAVYACSVAGTQISPSYSFTWLTSSAVIMLLCSVIALRHQDTVFGSFYGLSGAFWLSISYSEFLIFADNVDILKFITGDATSSSASLVAVYVCCSVAFLILAVTFFNKQIFQSLQCLLLFFFSIGNCVYKIEATYTGVIGWVAFLLSLYGVLAHLLVNKTHHKTIPLGKNFFKTNLGKSFYSKIPTVVQKHARASTNKGKISSDAMLGYSKYADVELVGFGSNATAALSILWVPTESLVFSLPWVVGVGGALQFLVGCVCFSRGKTFESCSFIIYSIFWAVWGPIRCLSISDDSDLFGMSIGCIAFIVVSVAMSFISMSVNKVWTVMSIMFDLLVLSFLLSSMKVSSTDAFEKVVLLLFACICLYCFSAATIKAIWKRDLLWLGRPILPLSYLHTQAQDASWMDANKASGVTAIAEKMKAGGICGIPTDTVYVLTAACNRPHAVVRAYNTKKLAEDRPMSLWISKVSQLEAGREEFGELLWALMNEVWPSTISLVVEKGPWLQSLGIDFAEKYIGKPDSIAVRMPDNTMTLNLIDQTGPIAVTSANPTGEADTTHHLQVLAKLGVNNCDGILCDGPSFENAASTVVDCRKINERKLGFFRVGIVPRSRVEEIFQKVQTSQHCGNPQQKETSQREFHRKRLGMKRSKRAKAVQGIYGSVQYDALENESSEEEVYEDEAAHTQVAIIQAEMTPHPTQYGSINVAAKQTSSNTRPM